MDNVTRENDSAGCIDLFVDQAELSSGELYDSNSTSASPSSVTIDPWINLVFNGVGILLLAIFGITANVLSVIVLSHPKLKSSLTTLLLGLTVSDVFVIGTSLFIFSLSPILDNLGILSWYTATARPHLLPWLLPVALTAQMSSLYFTVIITLERYIAVCLPLQARSLCTRSSAKKASLLVVFISFLYNIPRWFEYRTILASNCTTHAAYRETETDFRNEPNYILYYVNWGYLVVIYLIPFTILLYFNTAIYRETKKHRFRRNSLSPTMTNRDSEDIQLAVMLLAIVVTFIACNMLALVINVMESFGLGEIGNLIPVNNFLIVCSSSTNFVFYCVFGTEFRKRLTTTLRINRGTRRSSGDSENQNKRRKCSGSGIHSSFGMVTSSFSEHLPRVQGNDQEAKANDPTKRPLVNARTIPPINSNDSNNNGGRQTSSRADHRNVYEDLTLNMDATRSSSQITVNTIIPDDL